LLEVGIKHTNPERLRMGDLRGSGATSWATCAVSKFTLNLHARAYIFIIIII